MYTAVNAGQFHHKRNLKWERCESTIRIIENIIYRTCEKWGHLKENKNYKEIVDENQEEVVETWMTWWKESLESHHSQGRLDKQWKTRRNLLEKFE